MDLSELMGATAANMLDPHHILGRAGAEAQGRVQAQAQAKIDAMMKVNDAIRGFVDDGIRSFLDVAPEWADKLGLGADAADDTAEAQENLGAWSRTPTTTFVTRSTCSVNSPLTRSPVWCPPWTRCRKRRGVHGCGGRERP